MSKEKKTEQRFVSKAKNLGDFVLSTYAFEGVEEVVKGFESDEYARLNHKQKSERVNRALLELIQAAPDGTFLLMAVVEYIDQIFRKELLVNYTFSSFELWLNQFSGLSDDDNYQVRGKIMGKWIPRDEYQSLFPVGMGKVHPGSHFVTAHASPDLDTTIASFWGWVDAFAARVAEGVHIWNVPGGAPASSIEVALLFHHVFGANVFAHLAKSRRTLALSSLELMTQRGVLKQKTDQSSLAIDHERTQKAVILVDDGGYYLGDWRSIDVEGVRQIILLVNNCLRWFENHLHIQVVSLFAREKLNQKDLEPFIEKAFGTKINESDAAGALTEKQTRHMEGYLQKVLGVKQGLSATFAEFASAMENQGVGDFQKCLDQLRALSGSGLFDASGALVEDRPKIFHQLEEIISVLDRAIRSFRTYTERLKVALDIKTQVFGYLPQVVSYRADVVELKSKMGNYPYLTVTSTDQEGKMIPLGVIRSRDLQQPILGTVTLRDFCNRDETKIPSYFEVISVIDHHKTVLNTSATPVVYISDAQSSNSVVADLAFAINDKYSTGAMSLGEIEAQMSELGRENLSNRDRRILGRLLQRWGVAREQEKNPKGYYIDPLREFVEYLQFLYAILDDTDLLTKVSRRDVETVAHLLNRLRSLIEGKEVEIIDFDDLERNEMFVHRAASRILQHPDMYSLYQKIYSAKEQLIEENFALASKGEESSLFVDTKIQNGCVRIGQIKMFAKNFSAFEGHAEALRKIWVADSLDVFSDRREVDLHMLMVSTIAGADDLFEGKESHFTHKDQLWIWIPMTDLSVEHLKRFLNNFKNSAQVASHASEIEVTLIGKEGAEMKKIFKESFLSTDETWTGQGEEMTLAVIHYPAGVINSRKAMISPYLPKQV